ncbi:restriction endonuclease subunit S [Poseidonibacter sp.]|uniref:restriction endonuclease subunit S n=1 Tax=Poseidonibacter sp. TaxID=2321188 RepID=UPI003C796F2F
MLKFDKILFINDVVVKTNNVNPMNDLYKPFTYIDISSIDNKSFQIVEPKQLIRKEALSRAKKEVVLGDIVYSTTRPNLKNISIVNKEYDNPIASTGFCVLRVNENTINSYLFYYLITDKLFEQIEPNIRGTQYPATSGKDLKNCNIPNTPLIIQQKVVKYLDEISQKIEKIKQAQKDKMNSLKALKASILDQAFKGEL